MITIIIIYNHWPNQCLVVIKLDLTDQNIRAKMNDPQQTKLFHQKRRYLPLAIKMNKLKKVYLDEIQQHTIFHRLPLSTIWLAAHQNE